MEMLQRRDKQCVCLSHSGDVHHLQARGEVTPDRLLKSQPNREWHLQRQQAAAAAEGL